MKIGPSDVTIYAPAFLNEYNKNKGKILVIQIK